MTFECLDQTIFKVKAGLDKKEGAHCLDKEKVAHCLDKEKVTHFLDKEKVAHYIVAN